MCGIAGAIDLVDKRLVPEPVLRAMADAIIHRGPDEDGYLQQDGVSLASRRLSIVGLFDGRQPIFNEDKSVAVVFNGELFDYPERRAELEAKGHQLRTHCDTELIPHLWEEQGEGMFERLRGQFAIALYDSRQRRVILARDRFGICPLHWSLQGDWLLFASEVKGLLASGMVPVRPDRRGINHVFTFFALPGPVTCFAGVSSLLPGHYLDVALGQGAAGVRDRVYWEITFPEWGSEDRGGDPQQLVDGLEAVLLRAVQRRLRADVPVVSYLSGGLDSSLVLAMANKLAGRPLAAFTSQILDPGLDETADAALLARHVGSAATVVPCSSADILTTYPRLVAAAECPVIDTACAALLRLAQKVHAHGYKVALSGEGADDWLASYPWYKLHRLFGVLDFIPGLPLSGLLRQGFLRLTGAPRFPAKVVRHIQNLVGGHNGWLDAYGVMSMSKLRFYSDAMRQVMADNLPYDDLQLDPLRLRRWHPLHRALYLGARVQLPGLLLHAKGDRIAMHSSVETRYPFLDEDVFSFLARLHPRWKLRRMRDKYVLRLLAERWLPRKIAWRHKTLFRAPFDGFHIDNAPAFVDQLFSAESLRKTNYFDPEAVSHWRQACKHMRANSTQRLSVEMGLAGVLSSQLWHHLFIDASLTDLPGLASISPQVTSAKFVS
jgi:asparagine synthase (glutamine-hydrolysing)